MPFPDASGFSSFTLGLLKVLLFDVNDILELGSGDDRHPSALVDPPIEHPLPRPLCKPSTPAISARRLVP
jgi:hypothetical protein